MTDTDKMASEETRIRSLMMDAPRLAEEIDELIVEAPDLTEHELDVLCAARRLVSASAKAWSELGVVQLDLARGETRSNVEESLTSIRAALKGEER